MSVGQIFNSTCSDIQKFFRSHSDFFSKAVHTAKKIAVIGAAILVSAALLIYSPYAFAAGLFFGALFRKELATRIDGIVDLWNQSALAKIGMISITALTWPLTIELMTTWIGAKWAVYFLNPSPNEPKLSTVKAG